MLIIRLQKWDFVSTTIFSGIWRLLPINSIIQVINVTFLLSFRLICHAMQLCAAFQYICTFIVLLLYSAELIQIVCLVWIYFFSLIILQLLIGISHHLLCFYLNLLRFQVVFCVVLIYLVSLVDLNQLKVLPGFLLFPLVSFQISLETTCASACVCVVVTWNFLLLMAKQVGKLVFTKSEVANRSFQCKQPQPGKSLVGMLHCKLALYPNLISQKRLL